jgi:hypothetical protein
MPKVRVEQARLDHWMRAVELRKRRIPSTTFSTFVREAVEAAADEERSRELNPPPAEEPTTPLSDEWLDSLK